MADTEDEKNSRILAGLCYIPLFFINIIAILYILLAKKGGKYAKFHAIQALFVLVVLFLISFIIQLPFLFSFAKMFTFPFAPTEFFKTWLTFVIPMVAWAVIFYAIFFYLAYKAFTGKTIRIPFITNRVEKIV